MDIDPVGTVLAWISVYGLVGLFGGTLANLPPAAVYRLRSTPSHGSDCVVGKGADPFHLRTESDR